MFCKICEKNQLEKAFSLGKQPLANKYPRDDFEIGNEKLYGQAGNDTLFTEEGDDLLYGGEGNDIFQIIKGAGTDIISNYDNENDSTELLDKLKESDLTFGYIAGDTKIKDENDLLAIVQNTIAEDITFIF